MELKLITDITDENPHVLLIVPYGIETPASSFHFFSAGLLIVPYGIETYEGAFILSFHNLLIVPYGIETWHLYESILRKLLLIVPYGIETHQFSIELRIQNTFNRTLWN